MQTTSINVESLCVPCCNCCKYCLLSWNGRTIGADYKRSEKYALGFYEWIKNNRPDLGFAFYFGYSMEHPDLLGAVDFMKSIGSPGGDFLQFDGMKIRDEDEIYKLLSDLKYHGIKLINLTFYGTKDYHDAFARREGDYDFMMKVLGTANKIGLDVEIGIPLTQESAPMIDSMLDELEKYKTQRIMLFVPHEEGRGVLLNKIRFTAEDYAEMSDRAKKHFNDKLYKTEAQWLAKNSFSKLQKRSLTISLTPENIDMFEAMDFFEAIEYLEKLDDDYFNLIPDMDSLAELYGDKNGNRFYRERDLYLHWQRKYIKDNALKVYDINDERQCFVRRY